MIRQSIISYGCQTNKSIVTQVLALVFLLSAFCSGVFASEKNNEQDMMDINNPKYREEELDTSHLQILGLSVGVNTLQDVMNKLGNTGMFKSSPKEHSSERICYKSAGEMDSTVILFDAGPMGGWEKITSYTLKAISTSANAAEITKCRTSSLVNKTIATPSGLKLRLSKQQIKKILGLPTREEKNILFYEYFLSRKPMTKKEVEELQDKLPEVRDYPYYQVISGVEAHFRDQELISIEIYKVEAY